MTNPNIQGAIPLDGIGFKAKLKRAYSPGEYRRFNNVELLDGQIQNRRNISSVSTVNTTVTGMDNAFPFVGFLGEHAIVVSKTTQKSTDGGSGYQTLWSPSSLPIVGGAGSFHRIVGVYRYNDQNCWLTHQYNATTGENKIFLYRVAVNALADLSTITFASLSAPITILTDISFDFVYCNFFIQGERLWIVTSTKVYFSKALDHTVWSVPDGGFFDFQGQKFHYGMFVRDSIFLLCDNSVFAITYSIDPNEDSTARQLSDVVGGDHGCIHKDIPYFVNSTGIYAINNTGVEKVMDNIFDVGSSTVYSNKITSFEDYIILNKYNPQNYDSELSLGPKYWNNLGRVFNKGQSFNLLGYNVFFINTESGKVHVLDFYDSRDTEDKGYITDVIVNPNKDFFRNYHLYFMTNKFVSLVGSTYTYKAHVYKMRTEYPTFVYDEACTSAGLIKRYRPKIDIEIDSYVPDGSEYYFKKFRSLEIMAELPRDSMEFRVAYDNQDWPVAGLLMIIDTNAIEAAGEPRTHYPCRVGLNQRARSASFRFTVADTDVPLADAAVYHHFQISDMRVLWSYTQRNTSERTPTTTS